MGKQTCFREDAITVRMRIGDLLVRVKLVSAEDVERALARQAELGGRLGDNLIAIGAITKEALDGFLHRIPTEPADIAATGVDENELLALLMKLIYIGRLETGRQFSEAVKLPYHLVHDLVKIAVDRQLLYTLGTRETGSLVDLSYTMTDAGRRWALDALERQSYVGPAPVTLAEFTQQVNLQKLTNERISSEGIRAALGDMVIEESMVEQCGPALSAGRAMLLYGPPGNGKSSVAQRLAQAFSDVIYVPYAVIVEGQIIRVHDPSIHLPIRATAATGEGTTSFLRQEEFDQRWVPCKRPFVIAGGELTLEMLDLHYDTDGHYYEAPLHMKALGGCFVIDDFGRQLVSPTHLLNRWIVPLESRIDYLKLHTGKSFSIPFDELVIFSTNLEPEDLMDTAFLRRLPYKIEVGAPSLEIYRRIFERASERHGLRLTDPIFDWIVRRITEDKGLELASYHPQFLVDQIVATCRFMDEPPHFEPRYIDYAIDNLRVKNHGGKKTPTPAAARA